MSIVQAGMRLTVWGARGTVPIAPEDPSRYGARTCCVSIEAQGRVLIFDAGTGIVDLGNRLMASGEREIDLFLGHAHYDHVIGFPYFLPFYNPACRVRVHAGHMKDGRNCRALLEDFLRAPFHPVGLEKFKADIEYVTFRPTDMLQPSAGIRITTHELTHPNGAVAYRVESDGRSVVYATDHEHRPGMRDVALETFIAGADVLIFDTTFTDEELPRYIGYGHSTYEEGVRLALATGVQRLVLFHHSHKRPDDDLARIEREMQTLLPGAVAGRPGLEIDLPALPRAPEI